LAENASFGVLIDEIRPSVFAVGDDKKKKEREGKVHKVTRRYILAICGADTIGADSTGATGAFAPVLIKEPGKDHLLPQ